MQVPIFKIFVGWRLKKVPKVPFFFSLERTLLISHDFMNEWNIIFPRTNYYSHQLNLLCFLCTLHLLHYCLMLNFLWSAYTFALSRSSFDDAISLVGHTYNDGIPLWSVDNSITFWRFCGWTLFFALATCFCYEMSRLLYCFLSHNPHCCLLISHMCMLHLLICTYLDSFICCLPTIIGVTLMFVMYLI